MHAHSEEYVHHLVTDRLIEALRDHDLLSARIGTGGGLVLDEEDSIRLREILRAAKR